MSLSAKEFVDLKEYTTFRMGGQARYFFAVKNIDDLKEAFNFAELNKLPVFILGGGSNILLSHPDVFEAVVIKIEILGFEILSEDGQGVSLKIGAGEEWDNVVARTVQKGWSGIEALSWIPGTAGATPIQNVGAYGAEIADVLTSLEVYEIASGQLRTMTKEECKFKYRDSIFKNEAQGKFVITSITLKLSKHEAKVPDYPGVKKYLDEYQITEPTLAQIRQAIIDIRNIKLPDPKEIASVGSFFKNPIVSEKQYEEIKKEHPNVVAFALENGDYKIGAGWLLDSLGVKGEQVGNLQFYPNNALVLINTGGATFAEMVHLVEKTKTRIKQAFDINLEIEPIIV